MAEVDVTNEKGYLTKAVIQYWGGEGGGLGGLVQKSKKSVGWTFDRDFCYFKGVAKHQNLITSYIIPLGVMYLLVKMLDQYKVSMQHHWI